MNSSTEITEIKATKKLKKSQKYVVTNYMNSKSVGWAVPTISSNFFSRQGAKTPRRNFATVGATPRGRPKRVAPPGESSSMGVDFMADLAKTMLKPEDGCKHATQDEVPGEAGISSIFPHNSPLTTHH